LLKCAGIFVAALILLSATPTNTIAGDSKYTTVCASRWGGADITTSNESWLSSDFDNFTDELDKAWSMIGNDSQRAQAAFEVYQYWGFIPENETQESFFNDLDELYAYYAELHNWEEEGEYRYTHIRGGVGAPFYCFKIPPHIYYDIETYNDGEIHWYSYDLGSGGSYGGSYLHFEIWIFVGVWIIGPPHQGENVVGRGFRGLVQSLNFL